MHKFLAATLALALISSISGSEKVWAKSKPKPIASPQAVSKPTESNHSSPDKLLWDYWYTVTVNGKTPYQYYNERVTLEKGRIHFQNNAWKQEEGFINEEQLASFADGSLDLKPLFFNFHSAYRAVETQIDGTVSNGKLVVKIRKGDKELPAIQKMLPTKTFFSSLFPVWLAPRLEQLKQGKTLSFQTLLEDNLDAGYSVIVGSVRGEKPDAFATKSGTQKLAVDFQGMKSFWYVDSNGASVKLDLVQQHAVAERVSKEKAQSFFKSSSLPTSDGADESEQ